MNLFCRGCLCISADACASPVSTNITEHFAFLTEQTNITNAKIPLWFCWQCSYFLRKSIAFKNSCAQSDIILKQYLTKCKNDAQLANELLEYKKTKQFTLMRSPINISEFVMNIDDEKDSNDIEEKQYKNQPFCEKQISNTRTNIETEEKSNYSTVNFVKRRKIQISSEDEISKNIQEKNFKPNPQKNTSNTPAKIFDLSLAVVTTLTAEQQVEELEKMRKTDDYVNAPFKCEPCAKGFSYDIVFEKHKEKHETVSGQYICQLCTLHFSTKRNLSNHMDTHTNRYTCTLCDKVLISKQSIMSHIYTEHNTTEQQVKCDLCGKVYKYVHGCHTWSNMYVEHRSVHTMYEHSHIRLCGAFEIKLFINRYSYAKHMRIHKNSKEHKCHLCHKVFLWKDNLNRHLTYHKKEKPFSCKTCLKSFSLKQNLKDHLKTHSKTTQTNAINMDEKGFYCVECDLSYTTQAKLNHHLKRGTRHLQPEQLKFACKLCDKRYVNNFQLSTHIDRDHLNKRSQICQLCDAAFVSSRTLRVHIKSIHEGYRKPRNHMCEICSKGFPDKRILQAHLRTHTGERPYSCQYCSATFAHSGARYTHIKLVHLKIKKNPSKKCLIVKNVEKNAFITDPSNDEVNNSSSVDLFSPDKSKTVKTETETNNKRKFQ